MNQFLTFIGAHPILSVILALITAQVAIAPFRYAFLAFNRHCRSRNIQAKGWPPKHLDADGDFEGQGQ